MKVNPHRGPEVYTVTDAPRPISEDIGHRQRRYLMSMAIRTGCFVGAVVSGMAGAPFWAVGVLVLGALFLPYIAVVVANGGREPQARARFQDAGGPQHKPVSGQRPEIGS
ncbi:MULTISPECIES: DUF3099 domain-containing protein [Thermomonosporaceae]|uniref:DUF3099 domain-containing protein n=1 Tax=Thermomonosporaceae TaxID=2012 RepID=UPI00255A7AB0|nr:MULTISPECIES: DUF3099 domain-containing protein [Thermomonosporaceae]MDL4777062.1 DUF3099 domain-containing protein [Actinomadura xylanilytica]